MRCRELDIFKILEFFENFLVRFCKGFFCGGIFWEIFFVEDFFGRNYLVEINKELMFLQDFGGNS